MPSGAGAWRVPPVALTLMNQVRAWKHDTDLGNRLTDQTVGLLGRDAVLTIIGLQNAGNLPDCGTPAREQFPDRVLNEGLAGTPPLCGHPGCPALGDGLARGWLWRCRG